MIKKTFGIISYFPDADTDFHASVRKQRMKRCTELLVKLESLWPDTDIIIIAQNWQEYLPPLINNKITIYKYDRSGILGARRILRQEFLESDYDYLIMLDDDAEIKSCNPEAYMNEIDNHPDGFGVIRHANHALNLCAISKFIYRQIDLPDIDLEKSEGFGEDIFVAQCFNRFPDKSFDFPTGIVKEVSYRNITHPSTWLSEASVDWLYAGRITDALLTAISHKPSENATEPCIDLVLPYVDSDDPNWRSDYRDAIGRSEVSTSRFRSWGTLKFLFRGIATYMPFIKIIFLIVARESQVPDWLDTDKVRVIYHKDFIPFEYLPTFNSCTIESFLYNIPDLSEKFIYFNDDIFPINPMMASDFFTDGKPNLRFKEHKSGSRNFIYTGQCRSSLDAITTMLDLPAYPQDELVTPEHSAFPMLKSSVDKVYRACESAIRNSITPLRKGCNINQYIYHYYQYFTNGYVEDFCPYMYMEVDDRIGNLRKVFKMPAIKLVCLNDMDELEGYEQIREQLIHIFEEKFPDRCRYERD